MSKTHRFDHEPYLVKPDAEVKLSDFSTTAPEEYAKKKKVKDHLEEDVSALVEAQELLWANAQRSLLIIFQGIDAAGKDSAIKHVMSGINPQGCAVHSFRAPSEEELRHPFLWRPTRYLPARGRITIFNRSYYEEVLVVRVHPKFLDAQNLAIDRYDEAFWKRRYEDINDYEHAVVGGGTVILKFFLHLSKDVQKERFIERLDNPEKHWKFSLGDVHERGHWDEYRKAYEAMLSNTSTDCAPWHVIPADKKWYSRALIADIITTRIADIHSDFPPITPEQANELEEGKKMLREEK